MSQMDGSMSVLHSIEDVPAVLKRLRGWREDLDGLVK
jgi:hypothetical protein